MELEFLGICYIQSIVNLLNMIFKKRGVDANINPLWLLSCYPREILTDPLPSKRYPHRCFLTGDVFKILEWVEERGGVIGGNECMDYKKFAEMVSRKYPERISSLSNIVKTYLRRTLQQNPNTLAELIPSCGCAKLGNYPLYRIKNVERSPYDIEYIMHLIRKNGAVIISFPVFKSMFTYYDLTVSKINKNQKKLNSLLGESVELLERKLDLKREYVTGDSSPKTLYNKISDYVRADMDYTRIEDEIKILEEEISELKRGNNPECIYRVGYDFTLDKYLGTDEFVERHSMVIYDWGYTSLSRNFTKGMTYYHGEAGYWVCKNSWSKDWGIDGDIRILMDDFGKIPSKYFHGIRIVSCEPNIPHFRQPRETVSKNNYDKIIASRRML